MKTQKSWIMENSGSIGHEVHSAWKITWWKVFWPWIKLYNTRSNSGERESVKIVSPPVWNLLQRMDLGEL